MSYFLLRILNLLSCDPIDEQRGSLELLLSGFHQQQLCMGCKLLHKILGKSLGMMNTLLSASGDDDPDLISAFESLVGLILKSVGLGER